MAFEGKPPPKKEPETKLTWACATCRTTNFIHRQTCAMCGGSTPRCAEEMTGTRMPQKRKRQKKTPTLIKSAMPGIAIETDEDKTADYLRGLQGAVMQIDLAAPDLYLGLRAAAYRGDPEAEQLIGDCASAIRASTGMQCLVCDAVITTEMPGGLVRLRKSDPGDRAFIILPLCVACGQPSDDRMGKVEQALKRLLFPGAHFFRDDLHAPGNC